MKTNQNCGEVFCNNCNAVVNEDKTKLVLAQGLMMPNWLGGWRQGDEKHRHGFSILLRVCVSCYDSLNSTSNASGFNRVPPQFPETHTLHNFHAFHAEKVNGGAYCIRRKYHSDSYYHAPRGYIWSNPELITIAEENKFVYD